MRMKLPQRNIGINLTGEGKRILGKAFSGWAINAGRVIIVTTELIALAALFYRFVVDRDIIILQEQIKSKEGFLQGYKEREKLYRNIQTRLSQVKSLSVPTEKTISAFIDTFSKIKPSDFEIKNFGMVSSTVTIEGTAFSVFTLSEMIESLKEIKEIVSISLDDIKSQDNKIEFKLTLKLKSKLQDIQENIAPVPDNQKANSPEI